MKSKTLLLALTVTVLGYAYAASVLDAKKSTVTITAKQMNVPMNAKFTKVSGTVDYNPATPDATKASVDIDIASFDLGDPEYNKEVLKKNWFNAPQFPKASFVSTAMKGGANGMMSATGNLTIKGKTLPVTFPVKITKDGTGTTFDGSVPIKRLAFNIGEGEWADTGTVADEVVIKFHVVVTP
ncbi:polyisoprenoid-binding protein YceI [Oxalobacteraceae bacterium GrIS 2.11]